MLKIYEYNGLTYQFEAGHQPEGAIEVKKARTANKSRVTRNKTRRKDEDGRVS